MTQKDQKDQKDQSDKFARLRQLAEDELKSLPRKLAGLSPDEQLNTVEEILTQEPGVLKLVHELQVHQVELEMQHNELQEAQEKLRQERARYAELYHNAPVGYLTTTPDGSIIEVNTTGAHLLGRDAVALKGQSLTQWIVPDDQDIYYFHLQYLAASSYVQTCELRIQQPQQSTPITVRLESTGITNAEGEVRCRTVLLDVSERVRAEEALQQANVELEQRVEERTAELRESNDALRVSEERFRLVLKDSPTFVFTHDEQLRYTWIYPVRPGEEQILGKTDRDLLWLDELPHLTEAEAERLMQLKQQVLETAQGMRTEICLTTEGTQRWYDLKLEPLVADGRTTGLTCVSTDITSYHEEREEQRRLADENAHLYQAEQRERARAEAAAARIARLQRVTALLSEAHTPDDVYAVMVGESITATGAYAGGIALLQDDAATVELVYQQGYLPHLVEQWQRYPITAPSPVAVCIRTGELSYIESRAALHADYPALEVADQSRAWVNVPLTLDAKVLGCLFMSFAEERQFATDDHALLHNLGQQGAQAIKRAQLYAAEQHARRMAEVAITMRDQMFRLVSHDLRGPLTGIQGYTYLLRRRLNNLDLSEGQRLTSNLDQIERATLRMNEQIQELLDAASAQAGQPIPLSYGTFDLIALLGRVLALSQSSTTQHTVQLDTDISSLMIAGDEMRLDRVFNNLLSNAIKYSPRGGNVVITVTQPDGQTPPGVSVAVQDQGIGIPADALDTIFEPFRRVLAPDEQITGTGLGLASARQIVQQHGGTIDVESEEGRGSTFTVWLPVQPDIQNNS